MIINTSFTSKDYYNAAVSRKQDLEQLRNSRNSIIYSIYTAGVTIECYFRAFILKYTLEFDSKHDLEKLFVKSLISSDLDEDEKIKLTVAVKEVGKVWNNNLRYTDIKRFKRLMLRQNPKLLKVRIGEEHGFVENYYSDFFSAVEYISNKSEEKWNL